MKKLPMIKERKKPDARFFTLCGLVALLLAVSFWGQSGTRPASVSLPVERVPLATPSPAPAMLAEGAQTDAAPSPTPGPTPGGFASYRQKLAQTRQTSARMLDEVAQSADADQATVAQALAAKTALARAMEREAVVETLLNARGFGEALCTITESAADIVVRTEALDEREAVAILEIAARETGLDASAIRVSAQGE